MHGGPSGGAAGSWVLWDLEHDLYSPCRLPRAANDQQGVYMFTKGAGKVHKEGNVDPRTLHYEDQDVQLGHWPVSVVMNGYSGFIAQLHRIKQVGQRCLPWP